MTAREVWGQEGPGRNQTASLGQRTSSKLELCVPSRLRKFLGYRQVKRGFMSTVHIQRGALPGWEANRSPSKDGGTHTRRWGTRKGGRQDEDLL
jgi:hypothetical protein